MRRRFWNEGRRNAKNEAREMEENSKVQLGKELATIIVGETAVETRLSVPLLEINLRAWLLLVAHQESYIAKWASVQTLSDIEVSLWNTKAVAFKQAGSQQPVMTALTEILKSHNSPTNDRDRDVA